MNDTASKPKILIVDDKPENIHILMNLKDDYDLLYSLDGKEALETVFSGGKPDLILLDIMMPGMDGYEVCEILKANADTKDIPIIFITAMNRAEDETKGLKLGAVDYISKPFNMHIVRARISTTLRLKVEMDRRIILSRQLKEMNQNLEDLVNKKVAELKLAHKDLKESEFRLRQAQKMEALGTLAGGIAHDFNNILFSIMGYSEMTLTSLAPESIEHSNMEKVMKAGQRAGELIKQILSFCRQRKRERKPISIKPIVKEVLKLICSAFPPTIEIQGDIRSDSLILADPVEIHQMVMNLCTNALHAMQDKGGVLRVLLTDTDIQPDDAVQGSSMSQGSCVRLMVSDTGCGMTREIMERIYEPYFTTKPKEVGTGLGLATVYGIVEDLGGHISLESEIEKGSTFFIDLLRIENTGKTEEKYISGNDIPTGRERILLADDEEYLSEMLSNMLEKLGYHVTAYTSGADALISFKASPDNYDILLTDMIMPNLNGLELAEQVMAIRPEIPVLIITGCSNKSEIDKAHDMGITELIMKPVLLSDLGEAIRRALS
ncbi:response regulator [Desulfobacterales bacterium HSG17]|nr:response regulator [Desulfobacterales bacterium HSG17]